MTDLLPCPFCNIVPELVGAHEYGAEFAMHVCDASPTHQVITLNLTTWQSRPIEDTLTARVAELEAEYRDYGVARDHFDAVKKEYGIYRQITENIIPDIADGVYRMTLKEMGK